MFDGGPCSFGVLLETLIENYDKHQDNRDLNRRNPVTSQKVVATPACSVTNPNSIRQSNVSFCSRVGGSSKVSSISAPQAITFEDGNYELLHSVDRASLYNLVNETDLVHDLFLVYFVNFVYNLYMFRTSRCTSLGGKNVYMRHLVLSGTQDGMKFHPAYQTVSCTE
jgi:hypothetical protein